ncbi:hypothetical protein ACLOJK_014718 [Asimina triloba]
MGEKEGEKKGGGGGDKKGDGGKNDEKSITVVLKVDMHCDGCAKKVKKSVNGFEGVESVKADSSSNKLTVVGKVDPEKIRSRVEIKTKKKADLVSPVPKKGKDGAGEKKEDTSAKKGDDKKKKELAHCTVLISPCPFQMNGSDDSCAFWPVETTVVLKTRLHCDGCIQKIRRIIKKIQGVEHVSIDSQKDLVTVKGAMDTKVLPSYLKEKLKRNVEIVPPKKDDGKAKEGGGGGEKKDKEGGGGSSGGGEKKSGGGDEKKGNEQGKPEANKMDYGSWCNPPAYYMPGYTVEYVHAPQIFSDENPNSCSVM